MKPVFLPEPHQAEFGRGSYTIPRKGTIAIGGEALYPPALAARTLFPRHEIGVTAAGLSDSLSIVLDEGQRPDGYRLEVTKEGVRIAAASPDAAAHALRTLDQAARQSPKGTLPVMTIEDWPDFADRGIYYDVCRGRVPNIERLMELAAVLSDYKINQLQLYVEHTFRFRGHPDIGKGASPLSAEDVLELDALCDEYGIELVPSLASFGHMATVLKHPQYHHLAEDWGVGKYVSPDAKGHSIHKAWSVSPANPEVYPFLDSLYAEFLPLHSSERFNVCCDETYDLGLGQSYELCQKLGRGRVYLEHIRKLNELSKKHGKQIMFWGDIIRHYPDLIPEIPKDAIVLDWGYNSDHAFEKISDFKDAGLEFYACPGTSSWVSLFPRLHEAAANIAGFAAAAKANGGTGLLTTDWGDGGHYNFMELSWHGFLYGAEQAWNTGANRKTFTRRFCKLFMNIDDPAFAAALDSLGDVTQYRYGRFYQSVLRHVFFAAPEDPVLHQEPDGANVMKGGKPTYVKAHLDAKVGLWALEKLEVVRDRFAAAAKDRHADPHKVLPYWRFAVDTLVHAARKLTILGPGGTDTPAARRALKADMTKLRKRFEDLWMERNRRSEIEITLAQYDRAIRSL